MHLILCIGVFPYHSQNCLFRIRLTIFMLPSIGCIRYLWIQVPMILYRDNYTGKITHPVLLSSRQALLHEASGNVKNDVYRGVLYLNLILSQKTYQDDSGQTVRLPT